MDKPLDVVAVSYANTKPFIFGLETNKESPFNLRLEHPANCAKALTEEEADIGLVPTAVIPQLTNYKIITDYCIGCDGAVDTVVLLSDVLLEEITEIQLDYQSRTSVKLVQILAQELWRINPKFSNSTAGFENNVHGTTAAVVIGDRVFEFANRYKHTYDLGTEWKKLTNLPFVFACWVAKKDVSDEKIKQFAEIISKGLNNLDEVIAGISVDYDINKYLKSSIHFDFSEEKKKGLNRFFNYLSTLSLKQ